MEHISSNTLPKGTNMDEIWTIEWETHKAQHPVNRQRTVLETFASKLDYTNKLDWLRNQGINYLALGLGEIY